jgi:hypothetical protein
MNRWKLSIPYFLPIVFIALMGIACNSPWSQPGENTFATAAAETVAAELTQSASGTATDIEDTATPEAPTDITPSETPQPSASPTATCTDKVRFVKDVTIPDNTRMDPEEEFEKIWRLENVGTCTWETDYSVVFDSGNIMSAPPSTTLGSTVPPGGTIDFGIDYTAPATNGTHRGNWLLRNTNGLLFGLGTNGDGPFWVQIVVGPTPTPQPETVYNFVENYCSATWRNVSGALSCPGVDTDTEGFVLKVNSPKLENGATENEPALFTHPQWIDNGMISGRVLFVM